MRSASKQKIFLLFTAVFAAAVIPRVVLFTFWLHSPMRYYSELKGLDMQTLLEMGRLFYHGKFPFSLYNLLLAAVMFCHNGATDVVGVVVVQQLLGVGTALLTAWIALKVFRRCWPAWIAGTVAALYAPALIYETFTLRETLFCFTATLGLALLLNLRRHHFSVPWLFGTGAVAVFPFTVRFSGLLWYLLALIAAAVLLWRHCRRQNGAWHIQFGKKVFFLLSGGLLLLTLVALLNYHNLGSVNYISRGYLDYLITTGRLAAPKSVNVAIAADKESGKHIFGSDGKMLYGTRYWLNNGKKFLKLFSQYEIPNNINYYFMRVHLFPCALLPGPGFVLPLAVSGLLILLCRASRLKYREWLLLLYILAFALPPAIFLPLGRYRLVLYPIFAIAFAYFLHYLDRLLPASIRELPLGYLSHLIGRGGRTAAAGSAAGNRAVMAGVLRLGAIIILPLAIYLATLPPEERLRATDFISYGKALKLAGGSSDEIERCFAQAWQLAPTAPATAINYTDILLQNGKRRAALRAIAPAWREHPRDSGVALFASSALLCNGRAREAEQVLLGAAKPKAAVGLRLYYYNLAECYRLQGKRQQLLELRRKFK